MKSVDLKIRPLHHHRPDRVRAHVFLCLLAYYVEWHMRKALAPILFDDHEREAAEQEGSSVVAEAGRSRDVSDPRCLTYTPRSATRPHFSAVKISLHQPLRLPSALTADHDLDGAMLDHRLHHERPLQWGHNGMKGTTIGASVFVNHRDRFL